MTPADARALVAEARALDAEATPGPWEWSDSSEDDEDGDAPPYVPQGSHLGETLIMLDDSYDGSREDCALIARSRSLIVEQAAAIDALAARVEALEGAGAALRRWVNRGSPHDSIAEAAEGWDALMAGAEQAWTETTTTTTDGGER